MSIKSYLVACVSYLKQFRKKYVYSYPWIESLLFPIIKCFYALVHHKKLKQQKQWISNTNNKLEAYRLANGIYEEITPIESRFSGVSSLSDDIVQQPGLVMVDGLIFDLSRVGLYRFYKLPELSEQRLVGDDDFEVLNKIIGSIWSYGFEGFLARNIEFEIKNAKNRILVAGCVDISRLAQAVLGRFGIKSRLVAFQTLEPWGGQDDGHTFLEVCCKKNCWVLYDPSFNVMFDNNNRYLNAYEVCVCLKSNSLRIIKLPGSSSHATFRHSRYDYGFWVDQRYHCAEALMKWYKKIAGIPVYSIDGNNYFPSSLIDAKDEDRLSGYNFYKVQDLTLFRDIYE